MKIGRSLQKVAKSQTAPVSTMNKTDGKTATPNVSLNSSDDIYRIQVAAARTPQQARLEWDRIRRKHLDLFGGFLD